MKPSFLPPGVANRSLVFWDGRLNTALGRRPAAGPAGGRAVDSLIPFQPTPRGAAPARALRDYGKSSKDSVAKVKALYVELDVKGAFEAYVRAEELRGYHGAHQPGEGPAARPLPIPAQENLPTQQVALRGLYSGDRASTDMLSNYWTRI